MRLLDARRLTGPNLQTKGPAALAEVAFDAGDEPARAIALFEEEARALCGALGLEAEGFITRRFPGGAALCFEAPLDLLQVAADVAGLAVGRAAARLRGEVPPSAAPALEGLARLREAQRRPHLVALAEEARRRDVLLLWDDSSLSLGAGLGAREWPMTAPPDPAWLDWSAFRRIPIALVAGTNGKSTTARLLSRIVRWAGLRPGLASTDFIGFDDRVVDRGDYTGPAAARLVLRNSGVEVAVLETARRGILRRGLAMDRADAALITNVGAENLGEYGVLTAADLARAKAVACSVVSSRGRVVLNADEPLLVELARVEPWRFPAPIVWFAFEPSNPVLLGHLASGGEGWTVIGGVISHRTGPGRWEPVVRIHDIPICWAGAAPYNVANAMAAAALARALGIKRSAIHAGLRSFRSTSVDNPGRGNLHDVRGVRVLLDFGHSAHGIREVSHLVRALQEGRPGVPAAPGALTVLAASPGERSDAAIREAAQAVAALRPARVLLRDLPEHAGGRAPGEVPRLLREALVAAGVPDAAIEERPTEVAALGAALEGARPGDLVAALGHLEEEEVATFLRLRGGRALGLEPGAA